jgi:hypothetical protein
MPDSKDGKRVKRIEFAVGLFPPGFHEELGKFHGNWLLFDPTLDYSIGHFLKIDARDTHMLVSGMMFGTKLRLAFDLVKRSNHPKKDILTESIKTLQASKRDQITHAYIKSNATNVSFMYRSKGGSYQAGELPFHMDEFTEHVTKICEASQRYFYSLGVPADDVMAFANAISSE